MRIFQDPGSDKAVVAFDEGAFPGKTASTYRCGPEDGDQHVALHFDAAGVLIGATVERASRTFPARMDGYPRVTWDREADAAFIYLTKIGPGDAARNHPCDPAGTTAMIVVDFDRSGTLLGIEVLDAGRFLPPSVLALAPTR